MSGYLILEDGTCYTGTAFGHAGATPGEVVFNTGMTGYQEVLTDPSYAGQIVTMTYPLIGNYGINSEDFEARRSFVRGFVVKELCQLPSHWQALSSLHQYLVEQQVTGLSGIDTRALTRHLRTAGTMKGILVTRPDDEEAGPDFVPAMAARARAWQMGDVLTEVTTPQAYHAPGPGPRVVLVDVGAKQNIVRCLNAAGCDVVVVPAQATAREIFALAPRGLMLSNGPGDPQDATAAIAATRELVASGLPIFGICLGHQILGLALGGSTYKLKFGHRGANHPVKDHRTGRVYITSQNHGYAVDEQSLDPAEAAVTHVNLNDGTVEGLCHKHRPVFSVQYHPEAHPGPDDSHYLFERFIALL